MVPISTDAATAAAGAAGGLVSGIYDRSTLKILAIRVVAGAFLAWGASEVVCDRLLGIPSDSNLRLVIAAALGMLGLDVVHTLLRSRSRIVGAGMAMIAPVERKTPPDIKRRRLPRAPEPRLPRQSAIYDDLSDTDIAAVIAEHQRRRRERQ